MDTYKIIGKILATYPEPADVTEEDKRLFDKWMDNEANRIKFESMAASVNREEELQLYGRMKETKEANRDRYHAVLKSLSVEAPRSWWPSWITYVAAASVLALLSILGMKWFGHDVKNKDNSLKDIALVKPGQYRAKLLLDDGTVVFLDSNANGRAVAQGNIQIVNENGQLVYRPSANGGKVMYNTLTTQKGETYGMVLADGSRVFLNSASSVRYPVSFDGDVRKVEIQGEAYFEVAPSALTTKAGSRRPFIVRASGVEVEVLGTHFNVNGYGDESAIKATLLQGRVRVRDTVSKAEITIEPGQEVSLDKQSKRLIKNTDVDVDLAVAWHFGYFQFTGADLQTVLRQLSRWYDVDIEYRGKIPERSFGGKISRANSLTQVLETLESNDVHFKLEGRKIIVTP